MAEPPLYTYICDDVRYRCKDKPDVWVTLDKANGAMFRSYPVFSFIPGTRGEEEPLRFGDFVVDIDSMDNACEDAIRIIDWFSDIHGVEPDQWRIYLSGKKGVHLELPAQILGTEAGHVLLPLAYKRLVKDIEGELGIKLDTSMYNRGTGKPYRQPNIMRESGTCKRQIDYETLYEIEDEADYKAACNAPGPLWEPIDRKPVSTLTDRLKHYLKDAQIAQEALRNTPALPDEERDKLALAAPECVRMLCGLTTPGKAGNTFNDIAVQITASFLSAGKSEAEFMAGIRPFLENYPSVSLNTLARREENCRARYRSMAANGYQHSCGGILALGLPGFDCKQCRIRPNLDTAQVMTLEDLESSRNTLIIPDHVRDPGGLISLGMEGLSQPGLPDIPQFNLPVVLTTLANAIGGKLAFGRVWPNVYNIKVGPTSLGKTDSDEVMQAAVNEHVQGKFYSATGFSSGPALMRCLEANPRALLVIDEATHLFMRYDRHGDPVNDGKRDALLEIYTKSGSRIERIYSNSKNSIVVNRPCLSLTGNATPTILDAIQQEDFDTGIIQRFDFWFYDGKATTRGGVTDERNEPLERFAKALNRIFNARIPGAGNLQNALGTPFNVSMGHGVKYRLAAWSEQVVEEANAVDSDGEKGIISRKYNLAIKYALIHMVSSRPVEMLFEPMALVDIEYGINVAQMLCSWKLTLGDRISMGEFHKRCEIFKDAIRAVMRMNGGTVRPTFRVMANRRPALKNWRQKESEDVIRVLEKRGEIILDDSKRITAYFLRRNINQTP